MQCSESSAGAAADDGNTHPYAPCQTCQTAAHRILNNVLRLSTIITREATVVFVSRIEWLSRGNNSLLTESDIMPWRGDCLCALSIAYMNSQFTDRVARRVDRKGKVLPKGPRMPRGP